MGDQMSFLPGRDIFLRRSGLSLPSKGFAAIGAVAVSIVSAIGLFQVVDGRFVGSTLVSQAVVMWLGLALVSQMIVRRSALKRRWADRAFSIAFRWLAIPGLTLIGVGVAHFVWIEGARLVPRELALIPVVYLLASGVTLWLRSVQAFGIDNLSMMYVYFPAEGRLVDSRIYGVLRHPVYSAVIRVAFALILWNGSAFALFASLMAPLTMTAWLRWVEEPELIERFGDGYRAYRARVPAFFNLRVRTWPLLWRFLLTGR